MAAPVNHWATKVPCSNGRICVISAMEQACQEVVRTNHIVRPERRCSRDNRAETGAKFPQKFHAGGYGVLDWETVWEGVVTGATSKVPIIQHHQSLCVSNELAAMKCTCKHVDRNVYLRLRGADAAY
jgi:hypothetical protein